jgi:hypothetical protein
MLQSIIPTYICMYVVAASGIQNKFMEGNTSTLNPLLNITHCPLPFHVLFALSLTYLLQG